MYDVRKREYTTAINRIVDKFKNNPNFKIIIVENTSSINKTIGTITHKTFLDMFGVPVFYTRNNLILNHTHNYGIVELIDIFDCINKFQIPDDDFIVKLTGRYIITEDSPFIELIEKVDKTPYSAVVRFGQYDDVAVMEKYPCISTGLVGLKCKYVKQIQIPPMDEDCPIEYCWAKVVCGLNDSEICMLPKLGILIRPKHFLDLYYACM